MSKSLRAAIYTRVSSDEQVTGHSLDAQRKACVQFAETRGWRVIAEFCDPGESAKSDQRPEFQKMIAEARAGRFDIIITHKLDRFSRSIIDILRYMRELHQKGVAYVSVTEQFDFTTPIGKVMLALLAAFAEWYLDNLSMETKKGKRERAEKGLWNGDVPFGYRRTQNGTLEADPHDAKGLNLAFKTYARGTYTDLEIARLLNAKGYQTANKTGRRPFSKDSVRDLLQKRFYLGEVSYKGQAKAGRHPALIDQETFDRAQAVRRSKAHRRMDAAPAVSRIYLLSNMLYCGECLSTMTGANLGRYGRHYHDTARDHDRQCHQKRNIRADEIEAHVAGVLRALPFPEDWQQSLAEKLKWRPAAEDADRERANLRARLKRVEQLYSWGHWTEEQYLEERAAIQAELDSRQIATPAELARAASMLKRFGPIWDRANPDQRKRLLRTMLERVYIKDQRVEALLPTKPFYPLLGRCGPDGVRVALRQTPGPWSSRRARPPVAYRPLPEQPGRCYDSRR